MTKAISKTNMPKRVEEARALARFAKVNKTTKNSFEVLIPGHEAKSYLVILKWVRTGNGLTMVSECLLDCGMRGHQNCQGNMTNVCFHTIAATIAVAKTNSINVSFAVDEIDAKKLTNLRKKAYRLFSKQSLRNIWMII